MSEIEMKEKDSLALSLNLASSLEIFFDPEGGLSAEIDDESISDLREIHLILTNHKSGAQIRLRTMERVGGIDHWEDFYIYNPRTYVRANIQQVENGS